MTRTVRRWLLWCGVVGLGLFVAVAVTFWAISRSDDEFRKVTPGMTLSEVGAIVGPEEFSSEGDAVWWKLYRSKPRFWREARMVSVTGLSSSPRIQHVDFVVPIGPNNRSLLERVQDEYRYQKGRLGW
jgi:hypothetical protein